MARQQLQILEVDRAALLLQPLVRLAHARDVGRERLDVGVAGAIGQRPNRRCDHRVELGAHLRILRGDASSDLGHAAVDPGRGALERDRRLAAAGRAHLRCREHRVSRPPKRRGVERRQGRHRHRRPLRSRRAAAVEHRASRSARVGDGGEHRHEARVLARLARCVEGQLEQHPALELVQHHHVGRHLGGVGPLAHDPAAQGVERAHPGARQIDCRLGRVAPRRELGLDPPDQVGGGGVVERHHQDPLDRDAPLHDVLEDRPREQRRLARPGSGRDDPALRRVEDRPLLG